jgi:hypothetical protein
VRVGELESENSGLKCMYAELALENEANKGLLKTVAPACTPGPGPAVWYAKGACPSQRATARRTGKKKKKARSP